MIIVSACLLGHCCKYNGDSNFSKPVADYVAEREYIGVCPEELGGLPTPRQPVEIVGGSGEDVHAGTARAMNKNGQDVTAEFVAGAQATLALCREHSANTAILQPRSPSCGVHQIYDGSFCGKLKAGRGVTAALLHQAGIKLLSAEEVK